MFFGVEISILIKSNKHSLRSYGWADENKIIIFSSDEMKIKDKEEMVRFANIIAEALNEKGV